MGTNDKEQARLENDRANKEALAEAAKGRDHDEARRASNEATGLKAEIEHGKGKDPGRNRS